MFVSGTQYSRKQIYRILHPDDSQMPGGGNWLTGYVTVGRRLIAFCNIDVPGRNTAYDYPNKFNAETNILTWYGKNKAHSEQPIIQGVLIGSLDFHAFVRWNPKDPQFTYLGQGIPKRHADDVLVDGIPTIEIEFLIHPVFDITVESDDGIDTPTTMKLDPDFGTDCVVCGFSFEESFSGHLDGSLCMRPFLVANKSSRLYGKTVPLCGNCEIALTSLGETDPYQLNKLIT